MTKDTNIKMQANIDNKYNIDLIRSMYGDQRRYMQILMNFLSNAIKFTNKNGSVSISIKVMDR